MTRILRISMLLVPAAAMAFFVSRASSNFFPHIVCYRSDRWLVGFNVAFDTVIWLSYMVLAYTLWRVEEQSVAKSVSWIFWSFAAFILTCGFTHFMSILTIWEPWYWPEVAVKGICSIASLPTAVALWMFKPRMIRGLEVCRFTLMHFKDVDELRKRLELGGEK